MPGAGSLRLIRETEAHREFLLTAYRLDPAWLTRAEPRIRQPDELLPEIDPAWLAPAPQGRPRGG